MKAARIHGFDQLLVLDESPTPPPAHGADTPDHYALLIGLGERGQYALKLLRLSTASPAIAVDVSDGGSFDGVGTDVTLSLCVGMTRSRARFEVQFEATPWGTVTELREVIALAESGLTASPIERAPLERIHDVYARLARGDVAGRAARVPHV